MSYLFVDDQRARLKAGEDLLDEGTMRILDRVGLATGWRCLELGAGGGSIARWLAARVAPNGHVVATDINTRDLDAGENAVLEVRQHDIVNDHLEESSFDLVHARLVLEHLPERDHVLEKLVLAIRPGGWLVVEDVDYVSGVSIGEHGAREHEHTQSVRLQVFSAAGVEHALGRQLPARLRALGLTDVGNEGRVWVMEAGSPGARWFASSLAHLRTRLVGAGMLTDEEVDRMLDYFEDPNWSAFSPIIMAAWGRRSGRAHYSSRRTKGRWRKEDDSDPDLASHVSFRAGHARAVVCRVAHITPRFMCAACHGGYSCLGAAAAIGLRSQPHWSLLGTTPLGCN